MESRRLRSLALNKCRGGGGVCAGGCLEPKGVYFVVIFFYRVWGLNGPASQLESCHLRALALNKYRRGLFNWSRVVSGAWL